jgi:two-component system, cell cycle response regulator DivK
VRVDGSNFAVLVRQTPLVYSTESKPAVLIVDHDATNLRLARRLLESAGFEVCEATDAVTAFEALKTCRPAMLVLDIQLPGMDGWELTRRLKKNFATREIPIIAVTAFGSEADREYALAAGCVEFVEKSISTTELPDIIRRHLNAHQ